MNGKQEHALAVRQTDIEGALRRFNGNEALYISCLSLFLEDGTMAALRAALGAGAWDDAFTAAHALKGLAGNMGFVPLMHTAGQLVILIRGGRTAEALEYAAQVESNYRDIVDAIRENFTEKK